MEFDLFTFIAQVVNFLILVFLLYKFLFGKVKAAMDERERRISQTIEEADKKKAEAETLVLKYKELNQQFSAEKEEMLSRARAELSELRERLTEENRQLAARESEKLALILDSQKESFYRLLKEKSRDFVFALAEKMLKDLADENLERKITAKFIERIEKLDQEQLTQYRALIQKSNQKLVIKSSFDIADPARKAIANALREKLLFQGELLFETHNKGPGIELELEQVKISWNIEEYIKGVEDKLFPLFQSEEPR